MTTTTAIYNTLKEIGTARPILFNADMVRAILDGRKTQTRRLIKWGDKYTHPDWYEIIYPDGGGNWIAWSKDAPKLAEFTKKAYPNGEGFKCPYGKPGDHLWVRETWAYITRPRNIGNGFFEDFDEYIYAADDPDFFKNKIGRWRPSIFMPRAASRILLEITEIRPQRLHDITEAEAIAEGIHFTCPNNGPNIYYDNYLTGNWTDPQMLNNPIASYRTLWEKINGPNSWAANPWVWAITFKVTA